MDKILLNDVLTIGKSYASSQDEARTTAVKSLEKDALAHDTLNALQKKMTALIKACRKSCLGKSAEEREIIMWTTIDKLEETAQQEVTQLRDKALLAKGKADATEAALSTFKMQWEASLADLKRVEEVIELIKDGQEPVNGRNRKPGVRPEKLAVVRRAVQEAKEPHQEGE